MSSFVVDSSAVIALLKNEPGAEKVADCLSSCYISTVNYTEVVTYFVRQGIDEKTINESLSHLRFQVIPFDKEQAFAAGILEKHSKAFGLSLGDRCCLTLASLRQLPALTGDQAWRHLQDVVSIEFFR